MELGDGRRFRGRTALVTGGSSGIGLAAARRLAAEGAASDEAAYITGSAVVIDGGRSA